MAIESNITPYSNYFTGEDKALVVQVFQADGVTAQNITGWTLSYMVKAAKDDDDADALITKTTSDDIVLTTPLSGICTITLEDDDIAELDGATAYYHELKRTNGGLETVLMYGTFQLNQAVHA